MSTAVLDRPSAFIPPVAPPPVHLGPVWQESPDWDGRNEAYRYILPELTLGWQIIRWIQDNLLSDEIDPSTGKQLPFNLTSEQRRFVLWWYAVDINGKFVYRSGILQRLKGWGKDPLAAVIAAVEFLGPCRFAGWATYDMPEIAVQRADPVGVEHPRAWIRIAAVSKKQTKNTMLLFQGLFSEECKAAHGMGRNSIGLGVVYAHGGMRQIEAVTSSPSSLEGGRPTLIILNETHHWREANQGHGMFEVIERDAIKSKGGGARTLSITNAYNPSEKSVAQMQRESWEAEQDGSRFATGVLYDSLEADPSARIWLDLPDDMPADEQERIVRTYLGDVIRGVRGDAVWLDVVGIVNGILRGTTLPNLARRFWFNQSKGAEDAWVDPTAVDLAVDPVARAERARSGSRDVVRAGWIVGPDEPIVAFFDGSKSDDSTALVGCRVSDGYCFVIGVWEKPRGTSARERWLAPRAEIDNRVEEMFQRFHVIGFWADPSHTEDIDGSRYWDGLIDDWHRRHKGELPNALWAVKTGATQHSIMWDMTAPQRRDEFAAAAMLTVSEFERPDLDNPEIFAPLVKFDGNPLLVRHLKNAIRYPVGRNLVSLAKEGRESLKKVDLAVCLVGARMMRRIALNVQDLETPEKEWGEMWGAPRRGKDASPQRARPGLGRFITD